MDVYSFGMLCLWLLFGTRLSENTKARMEGMTNLGEVSINIPSPFCPPTTLETLKYDDALQ